MTLTARQLLAKLGEVSEEHLDDEVVVRVRDDDGIVMVGGLTSVSLDAGCGEIVALVLDGETTAASRYTDTEHQYGIGEDDETGTEESEPRV